MVIETFELHAQLFEAQRRFNRACDQIVHLGAKLGDLNQRYADAKNHGNKVFRRSLRLRILTVEGLVKTFTHYASMKKNEVLDLRFRLYAEHPDDAGSSSDDSEDDYSADED